jgi:hypothetical protein
MHQTGRKFCATSRTAAQESSAPVTAPAQIPAFRRKQISFQRKFATVPPAVRKPRVVCAAANCWGHQTGVCRAEQEGDESLQKMAAETAKSALSLLRVHFCSSIRLLERNFLAHLH